MINALQSRLDSIIANSAGRNQLCAEILKATNARSVAELGVYRGDFAKAMLEQCPQINTYTMIDPWRNLADWNKPANQSNDIFEKFYKESIEKTDFAKQKRVVLRGKTTEVVDKIREKSLDLAYIDGDHTSAVGSPFFKQFVNIIFSEFMCSAWNETKNGSAGGQPFRNSFRSRRI